MVFSLLKIAFRDKFLCERKPAFHILRLEFESFGQVLISLFFVASLVVEVCQIVIEIRVTLIQFDRLQVNGDGLIPLPHLRIEIAQSLVDG